MLLIHVGSGSHLFLDSLLFCFLPRCQVSPFFFCRFPFFLISLSSGVKRFLLCVTSLDLTSPSRQAESQRLPYLGRFTFIHQLSYVDLYHSDLYTRLWCSDPPPELATTSLATMEQWLFCKGTMSIRHHDPSSTWFLQLVHVAAPNHDPQVRRSWSIASRGTFSTLGSPGRSATLQLQHRDGSGTCKLHEDFHSAGWKWTWAYMGQFNVQCLWHSVSTQKIENQQTAWF